MPDVVPNAVTANMRSMSVSKAREERQLILAAELDPQAFLLRQRVPTTRTRGT